MTRTSVAKAEAPAPTKHCRLGGSAAGIYLNCTKAPELWKGRKRLPSSYTREGTLAHEIVEHLHRQGKTPFVPGTAMSIEGDVALVDEEMLACAADFVGHCNALRPVFISMVEEQVSLEDLWLDQAQDPPEPLYGTVDFAALSKDKRTIIVLDFKYGKGVPVEVENNPQLMFYALGVYYQLRKVVTPETLDQILYVQLGVFAPRQGDTEPRWWTIDLVDLLEWGENVLEPAVEIIGMELGTFRTGSHCRFCVGAAICPELYKQALTVAQNSFPDDLTTKVDVVTSRLPSPSDLSDDELGEALTRGELLATWLNAVRNETSSRLTRGRAVPGWKHVSKKGYRQWRDPAAAANRFSALGLPPSEILTAPELRSPAQIEKVLRVRKLDPKVVDPLTIAPVTGVTLVPSSHPAPAVLTSPGAAFPEVNDD